MSEKGINRRAFTRFAVGAAMAGVTTAAAGGAFGATEEDALANDFVPDSQDTPMLLRRISSLQMRNWQDYFSDLNKDAILCDTNDRVLHYWGSDGFYRVYPTSVPLTEEMTRRGRTTITLKRPEPDWRPTASMLERHPGLPSYVAPGEDNPLGVRALNLGWPAYRIHGTNDIRKIGRQSSSGCVGLFNQHIIEVYDRAQVGTPVLLI